MNESRKKSTFIIALVTILIVDFLLFNPWQKITLSSTPNADADNIAFNYTLQLDNLTQPSLPNTIRAVFSVPFDLQWYKICFKNVNYPNFSSSDTNSYVSINDKQLIITTNSYNCTTYKFGGGIIARNALKYEEVKSIESIDKTANVSVYYVTSTIETFAKPELRSIIAKFVLFLIAALALLNLLKDTYEFWLKGTI